MSKKYQKSILLFRFCFSFIFLWAFFDKVFGLGFATLPEKSWLAGVSPTEGFLKFGATGYLGKYFAGVAGSIFIDLLFMGGLLGLGLSMLLGIGTKIAKYSGALMMTLMYISLFPTKNNPAIDEHVIYAFIFWNAQCLGLFDKFTIKDISIVKKILAKFPILI